MMKLLNARTYLLFGLNDWIRGTLLDHIRNIVPISSNMVLNYTIPSFLSGI